MKKKILAILMVVIMLFTLTACTPNIKSYMAKVEEVSLWPGSTVESSMKMKLSAEGKDVVVDATLKGAVLGVDQSEVTLSLKPFTFDDKEYKLPDMKFYSNGSTVYIETASLKKIFEISDQKAPQAFLDVKEDYIALNFGSSFQGASISTTSFEYLKGSEFKSDVVKLFDTALKDFKPSVDMKIENNTYSYYATGDNLVDDSLSAVKAVIANWATTSKLLLPIMQKMEIPVTEAMLNEVISTYNAKEVEKSAQTFKDQIKGSRIYLESTFGENEYKEETGIILNLVNIMKMDITVNSQCKKDDNVKINFPTSIKTLSMEEYFKMFIPETNGAPMVKTVDLLYKGQPIKCDVPPMIVNNRTLVPCRGLFEAIGAEVKWDAASKTITVVKDNKNIVFEIGSNEVKVEDKVLKLDQPAELLSNRTMIPLRFLAENLGYSVNFKNDNGKYIVTID